MINPLVWMMFPHGVTCRQLSFFYLVGDGILYISSSLEKDSTYTLWGYTVWFMRKWGKQIESSFKNSSLLIFKTKFYFVSKFPNHFLFQKQLKIIKNVIRKQSIVSTIIHNSIFSIGSNWTFLSLFLGTKQSKDDPSWDQTTVSRIKLLAYWKVS